MVSLESLIIPFNEIKSMISSSACIIGIENEGSDETDGCAISMYIDEILVFLKITVGNVVTESSP